MVSDVKHYALCQRSQKKRRRRLISAQLATFEADLVRIHGLKFKRPLQIHELKTEETVSAFTLQDVKFGNPRYSLKAYFLNNLKCCI